MMKYDVFISYSRKDYVDENKNVIPNNDVSKIKEALSKAGITFWMDEIGIILGEDYAKITKDSVVLPLAERIWLLILIVIEVIAKALNCDTMVLTEQVIPNNKQIKALKQTFEKLVTAA